METALAICLGIGLSAACGFRVFVPLLITSIAAASGHLTLAPEFLWIGSTPALIAFAVATGLEIAGYYIPWLDHFLDAMSSPAAVVAGIIITASVLTDMSPMLKWSLAVIAGGGAAGLVQGATVLTRATSTATTGGLGNPIVATFEWVAATLASVLSLLVPVLVVALVLIGLGIVGIKYFRKGRAEPACAPN